MMEMTFFIFKFTFCKFCSLILLIFMYTTVGSSILISLTEWGRPQAEAAAVAVVGGDIAVAAAAVDAGIVVAVGIAGFAVAAVDIVVVLELSQSKTERKQMKKYRNLLLCSLIGTNLIKIKYSWNDGSYSTSIKHPTQLEIEGNQGNGNGAHMNP